MTNWYSNEYENPDIGSETTGPLSGDEATDVPECKDETILCIAKCLSETINYGECFFSGIAEDLPSAPGLYVEGVGNIAFPLIGHQAEQLIQLCEQAPFGKGYDTVVNVQIRNSKQLCPSKVKLLNSLWETGLDKLMLTIRKRLGFDNVPLFAKLYKILVYEKDGHFVKHKDTEKEDGMIATLIIQPPSCHSGGELVVYKDEKPSVYDFGQSSQTAPFFNHYAVHYADAVHKVNPVTNGYRLVLVYSICLPENMKQLASTLNNSNAKNALLENIKNLEAPFAYFFYHEYTPKSINGLGLNCLKGKDRSRYIELKDSCSDLEGGLSFYISKLKNCKDYYDVGNNSWEDHSSSVTFDEWFDADGTKLNSKAERTFDMEILNPDQKTLSELWGERGVSTYEGYLGNEGATKSTVYCSYALIVWPCKKDVEMSARYIGNEASLLSLFKRKEISLSDASVFLNSITTYSLTFSISKRVAELFEKLKCTVGSVELVNKHLGKLLFGDDKSITTKLLTIINNYEWEMIKEPLKSFRSEVCKFGRNQFMSI